ncbi:aminopeptidase [Caerostris extrusa]|uniref:Aminopeptidase n=1 Tax=Caerostris extrusa TaxID=172846 RepID=A0AAV4RB62_CAEEX|nr:aminopeptidase [Caerostris extrusa]
MQESPALSLFHKYVRNLMKPVAVKLGWTDEGDHLKKKLRSALLRVLIRFGDEETITKAKLTFQNLMHLNVRYLNYSLDRDKVRPQDTASVIGVAARNTIGRLLTWRFVRMNWPYFVEMFGPGSFSMDMILSESISHFSSKFDYDEIKNFFNGRDVGTGVQSLQQSLRE